MAQPGASDVHIDRALTNMSLMFLQAPGSFVGMSVFPVVRVDKQTDKYFTFDRNDFYRDGMRRRAPATESAGGGYTQSSDSYGCDVWALHKDIPDQVRANTDAPLNPDRNATQYLTHQALIRNEIQWAADYFKTGVWGTSATPSNLWSDYTSSDPIGDIRTGKRTVLANTGFEPNTLTLGYDVYIKLQDHPDVVDRYKYTSAQTITPEMLAALFEVERVLVCKAVKATNVENETAAYDFIEGKHALLTYSPPNPAIEVPSAGYTFLWTGISGGLGEAAAISRFRMEHLKADRVEIEMAWDNKLTSSALGYALISVVS